MNCLDENCLDGQLRGMCRPYTVSKRYGENLIDFFVGIKTQTHHILQMYYMQGATKPILLNNGSFWGQHKNFKFKHPCDTSLKSVFN